MSEKISLDSSAIFLNFSIILIDLTSPAVFYIAGEDRCFYSSNSEIVVNSFQPFAFLYASTHPAGTFRTE